jgi:hypothetical protein
MKIAPDMNPARLRLATIDQIVTVLPSNVVLTSATFGCFSGVVEIVV